MRSHILKHTGDIRKMEMPGKLPLVIDLRDRRPESRAEKFPLSGAKAEFVRVKVRGEIKKSQIFALFPSREQILMEISEIEERDKELRTRREDFKIVPAISPIGVKKNFAFPKKFDGRFAPVAATVQSRAEVAKRAKSGASFKSWFGFALLIVFAAVIFPFVNFALKGWVLKDQLMTQAFSASENLRQAGDSIFKGDFFRAEIGFALAGKNFSQSLFEIEKLGKPLNLILENVPEFLADRTVFSALFLLKAGENLSVAGEKISQTAQLFTGQNLLQFILSDPESKNDGAAFTDLLFRAKENLKSAQSNLKSVRENLDKSSFSGLSSDVQGEANELKEKLAHVGGILDEVLNWSDIGLKLLGHYKPQKYLLLFQNPGEIRATGGFIGTYGLLEIDRGFLKNILINGIFDIDGQLKVNVVPPRPIQRISTAWSTHDSNWFFDFPTSARKAAWFFEKTGNPTPDQVVALTPKVVEKLLEITGPIEMAEYGQTIGADNFVEAVQFEVEINYDKTLNKPKQFLTDLFPMLMEKLSDLDLEQWQEVLKILNQSLNEKDIMIFSFDEEIEKFVHERGWAGEIKDTDKDFLAVVSSNINGYKTDRVIDETITHRSDIGEDGSVIDTVTIVREHKGGNLPYDWWNRVNTNYLRVYVPSGSELLEAKGHTLDVYAPPIDYDKAGFERDAEVEKTENTLRKDENSGTEIFEESSKTVFGNWVYVSPGETVTMTYKYRLPFKLDLNKERQTYGVLIQKQPGGASDFHGTLSFPKNLNVALKYPEELPFNAGEMSFERRLDRDYFFGGVFEIR